MNVPADERWLDCMGYGAATDGQHIGRSTLVDHETCMDDSFHVAASMMWPSIPVASRLDCSERNDKRNEFAWQIPD